MFFCFVFNIGQFLPGIGRKQHGVCVDHLNYHHSLYFPGNGRCLLVYRETKKPHPTANTTAVTATAGHIFGSCKRQIMEKKFF